MKKKVYSKLLVLTALGSVAFTGVAAGLLVDKKDEKPIATKAVDEFPFVEWAGTFAGGWNPNPNHFSQGYASFIICLSEKIDKVDDSDLKNVSGSGDQVTVNGRQISELTDANCKFTHNQGGEFVLIKVPKDWIVALEGKDYCEIHINEGTIFDGHRLREITLHVNPETCVASIVPNKINTEVSGIDPYTYSAGWFRIDLDGYSCEGKDITKTFYNNFNLNFASKIYVNGNESNLLLTPNKESYSMTFNVGGGKGVSFNASELSLSVGDINSVTIPAGTEFPSRRSKDTADAVNSYVVQTTKTFVRYGNSFCEEVPTNVTNYFPAVWGGDQRAFQLEGFTDNSGSGGDKSGQPFNFISNIYINKDKSQLLSQYDNRAATYYRIGHDNTFGTLLCKDFYSEPETYVTIPAGTQFPDSKAWKGEIGGKVFVTREESTFTRINDKNFKKCTTVSESANYGVASLEGFKGTTEDFVCSGAGKTSVPINNFSPFGSGNIHLSFILNNDEGNNFDSSTLINALYENNTVTGGYKFQFARGYGKLLYNGEEIATTAYFSADSFDGKDWLIDMYVIKQDATHVRLVMTMNDYALVDIVRDCSSDVMGNLTQMTCYTTTEKATTIKNVDVDAQALDLFCEKGLKMSDEGATSINYADAKDYLLNLLTKKQKEMFFSSSAYASAVARLESWAQENSEHAIASANFTGINVYNNNKDIASTSNKITYLEFDHKPYEGTSSANIAGTFATINGVNCSTIDGFMMNCGDNGGNFVLMYYPASALTKTDAYPYTYFHADAGIVTPEVYPWTTLGEISMYLDSTGKWVKCDGIHTVTVTHDGDVKTMYIPDGATVPSEDLSKYCSYAYTVDGEPFDLATPITADTDILLETVEHDYSKVEAKESSCTEKGNIEYYECLNTGCDKVFLYEDGNYFEVSMDDVLLDLADHTVDPESVTFAFAADGSSVEVTYECSQCKDTFTVPSEEVTLVSAQTKAPTCLEKGETTYTATWGEYSDTLTLDNIPATGHDAEKVSEVAGKAATCKEDGYKKAYLCSDCGLYYEEEAMSTLIGDKAAYDLWILAGGKIAKESIEHTPAEAVIENVVEPTCTEDGSHDEVIYCSVCGEEISRTPVTDKATGHQPGEAVIEDIVLPTCTEPGSHNEVVYCSECGEKLSTTPVVDQALGHDMSPVAGKAATCGEDGYKAAYFCETCEKYFEDEAGAALIGDADAYAAWKLGEGKLEKDPELHVPAEAVIENIVKPTCTEAGSHDEVVYCSACGEELSRTPVVDAALGHKESEPVRENVVEPTCTEAGSYDEVVYCSVCGEELSRTKIDLPATGHSWGEGEVTKPATCTENGVKTFTCECGETKTEVIPATGHKLGELIPEVAATTEKEGMKAHYVCSECGQYFDANKMACTKESLVIAKLPEPTPEKKGCGGSVIAASAVVTGLAIAGAALIAAKKKED